MALSISLLVLAVASLAIAQTPTDFSPYISSQLVVQFPGSAAFSSGAELQPKGTQVAPYLFLPKSLNASVTNDYTIIAIDPDAPSRSNTSLANVLHWLQPSFSLSASHNSTANNVLFSLTSTAKPFSAYIGPDPSPGSGPHRYIFYLYKQPSADYDLPEIYEGLGRGEGRTKNITKFDLEAYVQRVGLTGPVAGTYFTVENRGGTSNGTSSTNGTSTGAIGGSAGASASRPSSANITGSGGVTGPTNGVPSSATANGGGSAASSTTGSASASGSTEGSTGGEQPTATSTAEVSGTSTVASGNAERVKPGLAIVGGLLGCLVIAAL